MKIEIDKGSGFCFGVRRAIQQAEEELGKGENLNCLGDIVHNHEEVDRLSDMGMNTIDKEALDKIENQTVLLRSHGEPPSTYQTLKQNNNRIIDATCPVVLKLQKRVEKSYHQMAEQNGQLLIFGKKGHPEVEGLNGQTGNKALVISSIDDLNQVDYSRPVELYSQTTMPLDGFDEIKNEIEKRAMNQVIIHDTICRQVANRVPHLKVFAKQYDVILFVSGKKSSNGKLLYQVCKNENLHTHFISSSGEIDTTWFAEAQSIGICGATSTPQWLMENVADYLHDHFQNN
ncbi:4-hydroxy-3-methylbut-2-enyl diphosphate reductase [Roseimarinus sediminis]|uniref:4-hydroxy-3-methylbut-2-enyl diphosphate reductase n=1 Tax=Roseimarinus sediminis TaxID=1610899 RepID=UPI003D1F3FAB